VAGSRLYDQAERVWREMYAQAVPVGQLVGKDAYLAGMVPVGSLGVYLGARGIPGRPDQAVRRGWPALDGSVSPGERCPGPDGLYRPAPPRGRPIGSVPGRCWPVPLRSCSPSASAASTDRPGRLPSAASMSATCKPSCGPLAPAPAKTWSILAALPLERQRELGVPCLGYAVLGAAHTCIWEPAEVHPTAALA
jgi:hypothetical protein